MIHQHGREIRAFGTVRLFPIALSYEARMQSCQLLNQILADSMILYSHYKKHHWLVRGTRLKRWWTPSTVVSCPRGSQPRCNGSPTSSFSAQFALSLALKHVRLALQAADDRFGALACVADEWQQAVDYGLGDQDLTVVTCALESEWHTSTG